MVKKYKKIIFINIFVCILLCLKLHIIQNTKTCHFSIDDTMDIFYDLTINKDKYNSIFENSKLCFLKQCNETYGLKVVLFCFYNFNDFSLSEATDKFSYEFKKNSSWLKFGFHAYDANSYNDDSVENLRSAYTVFQEEICRITGNPPEKEAIRLDRFMGTKEQLAMLNNEFGIKSFLGADSYNRENYYLDEEQNELLIKNDTIEINGYIISQTDYRIESLEGGRT